VVAAAAAGEGAAGAGLRGSRYRFLTGDLAEESRRRKEAWARPLPLRCHDIAPRIEPFLHDAVVRDEQHYGKLCITWLGPTPEVHVTDPELAKVVMSNKFGHFEKISFPELSKLIPQGLSAHEGEKWAKHRRILNPAFQLEKLKVPFLATNLHIEFERKSCTLLCMQKY
jgi:Cytochrome P450.